MTFLLECTIKTSAILAVALSSLPLLRTRSAAVRHGVLAIAVVLVLLPLATTDASALAGLGGAVIGLVLGLGLARLPEH